MLKRKVKVLSLIFMSVWGIIQSQEMAGELQNSLPSSSKNLVPEETLEGIKVDEGIVTVYVRDQRPLIIGSTRRLKENSGPNKNGFVA